MKTISVAELSGNWLATEKLLANEHELVVTRDAKPVARLIQMEESSADRRKPFDFDEHLRWLEETYGKGVIMNWSTQALRADRDS